jgi:hypothetical protein
MWALSFLAEISEYFYFSFCAAYSVTCPSIRPTFSRGFGFHPLHTWPAILVYVGLLYFPKTRLLGIGLVIICCLTREIVCLASVDLCCCKKRPRNSK